MIRIALLALLVLATVDGPDEHTVWEDEDAAREAALDAVEDAEDDEVAAEADEA